MRKASLALGITGSCIAAVYGLMFIGIYFMFDNNTIRGIMNSYSVLSFQSPPALFAPFPSAWRFFDTLYLTMSIAIAAAAIFGVIGCVLIRRRNRIAGVLFIIAGVLGLPTAVCTVLFILAAVFAYKKDKPPVAPQLMYASYPPGAYPTQYAQPPASGAYPPPPPPASNFHKEEQ